MYLDDDLEQQATHHNANMSNDLSQCTFKSCIIVSIYWGSKQVEFKHRNTPLRDERRVGHEAASRVTSCPCKLLYPTQATTLPFFISFPTLRSPSLSLPLYPDDPLRLSHEHILKLLEQHQRTRPPTDAHTNSGYDRTVWK